MFHKHKWKIIKETYAKPMSPKLCADDIDKKTTNRLGLGITTILLECDICHRIRKEEMLGK